MRVILGDGTVFLSLRNRDTGYDGLSFWRAAGCHVEHP